MSVRNTKQRDIIFNVIKNNRIHPTIMDIYKLVMEVDPSIGQATVYRCVSRLVNEGKLKRVSIDNDPCRYDVFTDFHYHLKCNSCGKIFDLYDDENEFVNYIQKKYLIDVDHLDIVIDGKCEGCHGKV